MYFVALVLPSTLNEKILVYKNMMHEKYDCSVALKSPAHITLVPPFWMEEEKEKQLTRDIDKVNMEPFSITTNDFSAFKPRTIFIAPALNDTLNQLKKLSDDIFNNNNQYKIKIDTRHFHPHITIATRDLHKKDFAEAWPYFEGKEFKEEWIVNGISLLRHNKKNWDVIYTSQFQNL